MQYISMVGAVLLLFANAAAHCGWLRFADKRYFAANVMGASLVAFTALLERQWGVVLLEGCWAGVSSLGLLRGKSMSWKKGNYEITVDPSRADVEVIHGFLTTSYWAKDLVERSLRNSMSFCIFLGDVQVGFARVGTCQRL